MENNRLIITLIALFILEFELNAQTAPAEETAAQREKRMKWSSRTKLGIFIHWGIYAVDEVPGSWLSFNNYPSCEEHMVWEKGFTVSAYNPQGQVELAKKSGTCYTVITAKHHDGVALWDTKVGDLSTVKSTPAGRDLIAPFMKEVHKQGLKLGLYYSLLDWSHPDYPNEARAKVRYENDPNHWVKFTNFNFGQLSGLNRAWKSDLYWLNGDWRQTAETWDSKGIINLLRSINPNIIVNSHTQGYSDYATPEQGVPVVRPADKYWELCMTMNDSWGHQHADTNYETPFMLLHASVDCLSIGGNLLLDIGSEGDGATPARQIAVLEESGRWVKKHKEAIYETRTGILCECFQRYTTLNKAGDISYLYLSYKPNGLIEVKELVNKVNRVWVVGNGAMLPYKAYNENCWSEVPGNLYVDIPERVQDEQITAIAVLLDDPIKLYRGVGQMIESNQKNKSL